MSIIAECDIWILLDTVCYLSQLGSAGARDLILCKTLLKIYFTPFLYCMMFSVLNKRERAKPFVRDNTDTGADLQSSLHASPDADSYNRLRGMVKNTERENINSNLGLLLAK